MNLPVSVALKNGHGILTKQISRNVFRNYCKAETLSTAVATRSSERTHKCNELNSNLIGKEVALCGWMQRKATPQFFAFHDGYGQTQLVIPNNDTELSKKIETLKQNSVVIIKGLVCVSPPHHRSETFNGSGAIEVAVNDISVVEDKSTSSTRNQKVAGNTKTKAVNNITGINTYNERTHTCGELRGKDVGKEVTLCGWLQFVRLNMFATLRDSYGVTQIIFPDHLVHKAALIAKTPLESILKVKGAVALRPPGQASPKMVTGEIEIIVSDLEVLNPAKSPLPFLVRDYNKANEFLRLKHRYIDLRYPQMQRNLRVRSRLLMKMREFLVNSKAFIEVETPTLFRRTPGGAREFLVPTHVEDEFYSLVQSPQQLKQMLMAGAVDRYFQIARCYRDEDTRTDRQPEFTQLDLELSFTGRDSVITLIEDLLAYSWPETFPRLVTPFPRMTYQDAMNLYGSDKPDVSFDSKIIEFSGLIDVNASYPEVLRGAENLTARALVIPKGSVKYTASEKNKYDAFVRDTHPGVRFLPIKISNSWESVFKKLFPSSDPERLREKLNFGVDDLVFIAIGKWDSVLLLLGKLRVDFAKPTKDINLERSYNFLWVVDFPLFLPGEENGKIESAHHPFTQPHPNDMHLLESEPLKVRGQHYDLVLNGAEVGGGSIRIHNSELQKYVLHNILGEDTESLRHLLDALESGCPPHGGIALGIDRLVAVMVGAETIREVIAFPKSYDGKDHLSGAPCSISEELRKYYHLPESPQPKHPVKEVVQQ